MRVEILIKNVFGTPKAYPENDIAEQFAAIAGTKTLTNHTLSRISDMGIEITSTIGTRVFWDDVA